MRRLLLASSCIALLASAGASFGADFSPPPPMYKGPVAPYVVPFSWTGFYIGINGGYAWGDSDLSNSSGSFSSSGHDGWLIGGTLGYNYQTGNWVWGIEGDIDYALIEGVAQQTVACAAGGCQVKNTWFGTVRGRVGYAGWTNFLPYFTGGGAFAGLKVEPSSGGSSTETQTGWTVGAGVEYAFLGNWSAKLEYLYADLGDATCGAGICGVETTVNPKLNIVRGGLNYRF